MPASVPASGPSLVSRLVRSWMPLAILTATAALVVRSAARPLGNTDTYFHLRFGAEFLDGSWSLRDPGTVSSFATRDWLPTQWLTQVVMAQLESWWGLPGVAWLAGALMLAVAATFYLTARRRADRLAASVVAVLAVIACAPSLSMRPQVVSYLLTAVTVSAWLGARDRARPPWLLVPLTWVWAMCHGMWPVGVVISSVAALGIVADLRPTRRVAAGWFAVPIGSLVVSMLTPVGWGLLPAVALVGSRGEYFAEWAPTDFTEPANLVLLVLALTTVLVLTRRRMPWLEVLLVGLACGWALWSSRGVPVAGAMLAPLAAGSLQQLIGPRPPVRRAEGVVVATVFLAAASLLALLVPHSSDKPIDRPSWSDTALAALPPGTVVLNDWGWGGFLMWRHPQLDLVMHGYGDTFTTGELDRNVDILDLEPGWDDLVRETGARHALLESDHRLAYALEEQGWERVHDDDKLAYLVAPEDWSARNAADDAATSD